MKEFDGEGAGVKEGFDVGRVLVLKERLCNGSVDGCGLEFDEGFSTTGGVMQVPTNFQNLDAFAVLGPGPGDPSPGNGTWLTGGIVQ